MFNTLRFAINAMSRMALEDPVFFTTQVIRRLPQRLRDFVELSGFHSTIETEHCNQVAITPRLARFVNDEIRAIHGREPSHQAPAYTHARYQRAIGELSTGLSILKEDSLLYKRFNSELALLTSRSLRISRRPPFTPRTDVLHVLVNSLPHTTSGYTVRSHAILRHQRAAGLDVSAVTRLGYPVTIGKLWAGTVDELDGIEYYHILPRTLPHLPQDRLALAAIELASLVSEIRPRILHATTNYENGIVTRAVARAFGLPWIYEMRGQLERTWIARLPQEIQSSAEESERFLLMREQETKLAKDADAVVVLSRIQADELIARGVDADKVWIVPNAFTPPTALATASRENARDSLGLRNVFTVGTVSALVDYEGLDCLIEAILHCPDMQCVIVGDGVSRPHLLDLVHRHGLEGRVILPGKVSPEESHIWYRALDVFCVPRKDTSVTRTVTPIKPLEAMNLGIPIVGSELPALRELIFDNRAGLPHRPEDSRALADALNRLANDSELYDQLSKNGQDLASRSTWEQRVAVYKQLYSSL